VRSAVVAAGDGGSDQGGPAVLKRRGRAPGRVMRRSARTARSSGRSRCLGCRTVAAASSEWTGSVRSRYGRRRRQRRGRTAVLARRVRSRPGWRSAFGTYGVAIAANQRLTRSPRSHEPGAGV